MRPAPSTSSTGGDRRVGRQPVGGHPPRRRRVTPTRRPPGRPGPGASRGDGGPRGARGRRGGSRRTRRRPGRGRSASVPAEHPDEQLLLGLVGDRPADHRGVGQPGRQCSRGPQRRPGARPRRRGSRRRSRRRSGCRRSRRRRRRACSVPGSGAGGARSDPPRPAPPANRAAPSTASPDRRLSSPSRVSWSQGLGDGQVPLVERRPPVVAQADLRECGELGGPGDGGSRGPCRSGRPG